MIRRFECARKLLAFLFARRTGNWFQLSLPMR